ncbi:MAG TPA: DUF885 family protein [Bacteroidota bacterium]|nr:DUF885 family protein [Bacteroidota bacterium]
MRLFAISSRLCIAALCVVAGATAQTDVDTSRSEMRVLLERFNSDRMLLNRSVPIESSPAWRTRFRQFYSEWQSALHKTDFETLSNEGRIDYVLFVNLLKYEVRQLDIQTAQFEEMEPVIPFAGMIIELEEARRRMDPLDPAKAAAILNNLKKKIEEKRKDIETGLKSGKTTVAKPTVAYRAVNELDRLRGNLKNWNAFYGGYDPMFNWWMQEPYKKADQSIESYGKFLKEKLVGIKPDEVAPTIGDPLGREALMVELANEMIPYSPEELIAIAEKEMAFCDAEMLSVSRELGYGDDWHKALEYVKTLHVEPGKQPQLIRELALEAIEFVEQRELVTVPPLAKESWRMNMMTPERQLVSPFFTGGEVISVAYPTNTMDHEQKMMSMRGNNRHFSRATVQHELIPGHHLQGFMASRYKAYRRAFSTPFMTEGWALYWELVLWDLKFPKSAEDRVGMLFWRMHRCARIIFSLNFHLGKMSPQECIDFLVNRVGHERDNAAAEVRRSFGGNYAPLYQAAYLLGGLQIYSLRKALVDSGKMTDRQFHDAILKGGNMPIEMVRASLLNEKLPKSFSSQWRFYDQEKAR